MASSVDDATKRIKKEVSLKSQKKYPVMGFIFVAAAVFFIGIFLGRGENNQGSTFSTICTMIASFLMTTSGLLIILQNEAPRPGFPSITGIRAIFSGLMLIIPFGFGGIILLRILILNLIGR